MRRRKKSAGWDPKSLRHEVYNLSSNNERFAIRVVTSPLTPDWWRRTGLSSAQHQATEFAQDSLLRR